MSKVPLIAKVSLLYAGKRVASGAEFEARTGSDARLLIAIGKADFAPAGMSPTETAAAMAAVPAAFVEVAPAAEEAPTFVEATDAAPIADEVTAETVAEPPAAPAEEAPPVKPRRTYRRRDLTAEGSE